MGQSLWVRATARKVSVYTADYQLVTTHSRVTAGQRQTQPDHVVTYKQAGVFWNADICTQKAEHIGSATLQTVQTLLSTPILDPLPTTRRLLKLAERYSPERLEAACQRALAFGDPSYTTIQGILKRELDHLPVAASSITPPPTTFVRSPQELLGQLAQVQL